MTEILTESFCERCGTRYTFESARPRARLKGVKVLSRGLKNFVMSDDSSIDEAMAAARSDTDRELTAHQLDAFHKTFNFCMSCRQYTCPNCWNEAEARCLTCAPHLGQDVMPAPFPDLITSSYRVADHVDAAPLNGSNGHDVIAEDVAASGVDTADFAARLQALMAPPAPEAPVETAVETVAAAPVVEEVVGDAPAAAVAAPESQPQPLVAEPAEAVAEFDEPAEAVAEFDEPVAAEPVAAEPLAAEPVAAEPLAAIEAPAVEPVAADDEPLAAARPADRAESDEAAETAARLAAWAAAAASFDAAHDDEAHALDEASQRGAAQTGGLLRRFRAGQDLDAELDAFERDQTPAPEADEIAADANVAAVEPDVHPEAVIPEPVPEAVATVEPEPEPAAAIEPAPEPVAAVELEPIAAAEQEPAPAPEPVDVIEQPTWRMVAPDPTNDAPATPQIAPSIPAAASAPDPNAEPQWPTRPGAPSVGLPFLNRPPAATGGLEALWAESARDVVAPPGMPGRPAATGGVQPCVSCGLSLSATARFCRRCGSPQAV